MPYFRAFQLFWLRLPYLWIQSLLWWISIVSYFDIQVNPCWNRTLTYHFSASISLNHDWTLGGACYIHLTKRTSTHHIVYYFYILVNFYKQTFPCIHIFPLNLLPISGSPIRSFSLMQTLKIRSLHSTLRQYICSPDTLFSSFV